MQRQTNVTAYLKSRQLLLSLFVVGERTPRSPKYLATPVVLQRGGTTTLHHSRSMQKHGSPQSIKFVRSEKFEAI